MERIIASGSIREHILSELQIYRVRPALYVEQEHPEISFHPLEMLLCDRCYAHLLDQALFAEAIPLLTQQLQRYGPYTPLDPARVWVGVASPSNTEHFGGFYHSGQGYRYLQQIAVVSLSGSLSSHPVDRTLITLELLRAYVHDTLHYNSYRLFFSQLEERDGPSFYRMQYGINFRRGDGRSYSAKDMVRSLTTRNLGNIMEGATDCFAQSFVSMLAQTLRYKLLSLVEQYIYHDCTGVLNAEDMRQLREVEKGTITLEVGANFRCYLKLLRLFVQYVDLRYRVFLNELDPEGAFHLHHTILISMLSGKLRPLSLLLDTILARKHSFIFLFKSSTY